MLRRIFTQIRTFATQGPLSHGQGFESGISLKNIYPSSSLDITRKLEVPASDNKFSGYIPMDKLDMKFSRSSGPGGQSVNKSNTKVDIRFRLDSADWIPSDIRTKMSSDYATHLNKEGYFIVKSDRTRSQRLNIADSLDKLRHMIRTASYEKPEPSYKHLEIARRRLEKASRVRLQQKRERSFIKRSRSGHDME